MESGGKGGKVFLSYQKSVKQNTINKTQGCGGIPVFDYSEAFGYLKTRFDLQFFIQLVVDQKLG